MDIILSKDQRIEKLEKEIRELEKRMNRDMAAMNESFRTFKNVTQRLQKENDRLRNELRLLGAARKAGAAVKAVAKPVAEPVANVVLDASDAFVGFMLEDTGVPGPKNEKDLLAFVERKRKTTAEAAAKELGVSEGRVRYWASKLAREGRLEAKQVLGRMELAAKE